MPTKVLVFESDAAFAEELREGLSRLDCSVTVVDDASAGLQTAARDRPDLILLAIELPRMNGFSVCNKLKRDPGLKDVPLIIMSSESSDETFEQHRRLRLAQAHLARGRDGEGALDDDDGLQQVAVEQLCPDEAGGERSVVEELHRSREFDDATAVACARKENARQPACKRSRSVRRVAPEALRGARRTRAQSRTHLGPWTAHATRK